MYKIYVMIIKSEGSQMFRVEVKENAIDEFIQLVEKNNGEIKSYVHNGDKYYLIVEGPLFEFENMKVIG